MSSPHEGRHAHAGNLEFCLRVLEGSACVIYTGLGARNAVMGETQLGSPQSAPGVSQVVLKDQIVNSLGFVSQEAKFRILY